MKRAAILPLAAWSPLLHGRCPLRCHCLLRHRCLPSSRAALPVVASSGFAGHDPCRCSLQGSPEPCHALEQSLRISRTLQLPAFPAQTADVAQRMEAVMKEQLSSLMRRKELQAKLSTDSEALDEVR